MGSVSAVDGERAGIPCWAVLLRGASGRSVHNEVLGLVDIITVVKCQSGG